MSSHHRKSNPSDNNYYNYTVNLRLAPVECGIKCSNSLGDIQQFIHLNAFNNYFNHLLPEHNGFSLPDVWDGYYHITLGKFRLNLDSRIELKEKRLRDYIKNNSSPEEHYPSDFSCKFRTVELNVYSGEYRHAEAEGIDYVTLKVESLCDNLEKLYPFLEIIRKGVQRAGGQWQIKSFQDYLNELHVTVRKYKEDDSYWTSEFIKNCGIMECVRQNPLEFECFALDITQTRRQARRRNSPQWWIGVRGIPLTCSNCNKQFRDDSPGRCSKCGCDGGGHMCSGCEHEVAKKWPGYCEQCEEYERIKPLWSTKS